MSNKRVKAERSAFKDKAQGIVEQRPVSGNSKGKKDFIFYESFGKYSIFADTCFKRSFKTAKARDESMKNSQAKGYLVSLEKPPKQETVSVPLYDTKGCS
jgi:hypothetical protein